MDSFQQRGGDYGSPPPLLEYILTYMEMKIIGIIVLTVAALFLGVLVYLLEKKK